MTLSSRPLVRVDGTPAASSSCPASAPIGRRRAWGGRPTLTAASAGAPVPTVGATALPRARGPRPPAAAATGPVDESDWSTYEQLQYERGYCSIGAAKGYSPQSVWEETLAQPGGMPALASRAACIATRLGAVAAAWVADGVVAKFSGAGAAVPAEGSTATPVDRAAAAAASAAESKRVRARAAALRSALAALGPAFIKAGQVLASRPDIVREDYMDELCALQDDVPPFPDEEAYAIMEADLGAPVGAVFSSISSRPIAAASLGQVYRAVLRETGEAVAVKVQRPGVRPIIMQDLVLFRALAALVTPLALRRLGCNAELIVDEFGEKLLEELDYTQEARNIEDFGRNFADDPTVKIPWVRRDLSGRRVLVMEWIDGLRCTDPAGIAAAGIDVDAFIRSGVVAGLRQLLEFGLFHGDPHPGNVFALRDGRIAYVDFGNVAELSARNQQTLIDAVVHAVNEDYEGMASDFTRLGFLAPGTDITTLVPALEAIWSEALGSSLADFNFRSVTSRFNELVYEHPIRIPERYALVIRSLLTQEGICLRLRPAFHFLEVAYPYVARRLLTDDDPALRARLIQVLLQDGKFQWARLENLVMLARAGAGGGGGGGSGAAVGGSARDRIAAQGGSASGPSGLDLSDTVASAARLVASDPALRRQLLDAMTEGDRLHITEVARLGRLLAADVDGPRVLREALAAAPAVGRQVAVAWADSVLSR